MTSEHRLSPASTRNAVIDASVEYAAAFDEAYSGGEGRAAAARIEVNTEVAISLINKLVELADDTDDYEDPDTKIDVFGAIFESYAESVMDRQCLGEHAARLCYAVKDLHTIKTGVA